VETKETCTPCQSGRRLDIRRGDCVNPGAPFATVRWQATNAQGEEMFSCDNHAAFALGFLSRTGGAVTVRRIADTA
jgi:hypothetical protein